MYIPNVRIYLNDVQEQGVSIFLRTAKKNQGEILLNEKNDCI